MSVSVNVFTRKPKCNQQHDTEDLKCQCWSCCKTDLEFASESISKEQIRFLHKIQGITFRKHWFEANDVKEIGTNLQRALLWYKNKIKNLLIHYSDTWECVEFDPLNNKEITKFMDAKAHPNTYHIILAQITNGDNFDKNECIPILNRVYECRDEWTNLIVNEEIFSSNEWKPTSYYSLLRLTLFVSNCSKHNLCLDISK